MTDANERRVSPLAEAELEVLAEGREWMRRRLEEKLQRQADRQGAVSPLSGRTLCRVQRRQLTLRVCAGEITIDAAYGREPLTGAWLFPVRELWGLLPKQRCSPVLEERLCATATAAGSFERAAQLAQTWGTAADDALVHRVAQRCGTQAEQQTRERVERALDVETRAAVVAEAKAAQPRGDFSLVLMLDGWLVRERGAQWGLKPAERPAARVEWREMKTGIVFRLDQRGQTQSGRRLLVEKFYAAWRGEPEEFGRRLYAEALRRGLHQARRVYVVADGGVWIWNLVADRFSGASGVLDYYHAAQHLWAVAHELHADETAAQAWVEPLLHQLKHGGERGVLRQLEQLLELCRELPAAAAQNVTREVRYFQQHRERLHYRKIKERGCLIGSGAMYVFSVMRRSFMLD